MGGTKTGGGKVKLSTYEPKTSLLETHQTYTGKHLSNFPKLINYNHKSFTNQKQFISTLLWTCPPPSGVEKRFSKLMTHRSGMSTLLPTSMDLVGAEHSFPCESGIFCNHPISSTHSYLTPTSLSPRFVVLLQGALGCF